MTQIVTVEIYDTAEIATVVAIEPEEITTVEVADVVLISGGSNPITQSFAGQTTVTITHNRGYEPHVEVLDASGNEIDCAIRHTSLNVFTANFNIPVSGKISYI